MKYISMFFIGSSSHSKRSIESLVVHLHFHDERKKFESLGRKGMESIEDSMNPKVEEHEDSKKEIKVGTTN
jgi:hypothetical protein